jgi:CHASE2 domain-containing sensor protein
LLNKKFQNNYYSLKNSVFWNQIAKEIIIVEIDDRTLKIDKTEGLWLWRFPFNRKSYIPVIENLKKAGAKVIAFDIIFSEKTPSDDKLSKAIKDAGNVLIGSFFSNEVIKGREETIFNKSIFSDSILATWYFSPEINEYNHIVYSITPFRLKNGSVYDHFSFAILKAYYGYIYDKDYFVPKPKRDDNFYYLTQSKKIPFANKWGNDILINYFEYDNYKQKNKVVSFIDVYDTKKFEELKNFVSFENKIVLIW